MSIAVAQVAKSSLAAKELKVLSTGETLAFLKAGGSMARFGDGEFWCMDNARLGPVVRSRSLQESLVHVARLGSNGCPGFKPAIVNVLGKAAGYKAMAIYRWFWVFDYRASDCHRCCGDLPG